MAKLTRDQVGDLLRSLGFNETEAAGDRWFWYEYPSPSWERNKSGLHVARIQFYVPRSELDCWLYLPHRVNANFFRVADYVGYEQNVYTLATQLLRERLIAIAKEFARPPRELIEAAREDDFGARVLSDWLQDLGIEH